MGPRAKPGVAAGEGLEPSKPVAFFNDNRSLSNAWILPFYARRPGRVTVFPYTIPPCMGGCSHPPGLNPPQELPERQPPSVVPVPHPGREDDAQQPEHRQAANNGEKRADDLDSF